MSIGAFFLYVGVLFAVFAVLALVAEILDARDDRP